MSRMGGKYYKKGMKLSVVNFDNVEDYLKVVNVVPAQYSDQGSRERGRSDFFGTSSYEEALKLAETGWAEGAQQVIALRDKFDSFLQAQKSARVGAYGYEVSGDWLDVGRYLDGEPECFGIEVNDGEIVSQKVVSLRLNNTVSAAVTTEQIIRRGLTVLLAVDLLEACGLRVEVIVCQATYYYGTKDHREMNLTIKDANQPVDIDRLAFWIAHPSAFRRFGFSYFEHGGHPSHLSNVSTPHDHGTREGTVEFESYESCGTTEQDILDDVRKIAAGCGLTHSEAL